MNPTSQRQHIQPPSAALMIRPQSYRQALVLGFIIILSITTIGLSIAFSPWILFFLIILIPGIVLPILYLKNGFLNVTLDGVELSGFRGNIAKRISYNDVYQVVLVDELVVSIRNGAIGYAIVFLDKNGDQLFFAWSVHYTKEDLINLYNLFDPKDKVYYKESLRLDDLKQRFLSQPLAAL